MAKHVQMPTPDYGNKTAQNYRNGYLVPTYGEATVKAAEMAAVLDFMIMAGVVRPKELIDKIEQKCRQIDDERRRSANLESDRR